MRHGRSGENQQFRTGSATAGFDAEGEIAVATTPLKSRWCLMLLSLRHEEGYPRSFLRKLPGRAERRILGPRCIRQRSTHLHLPTLKVISAAPRLSRSYCSLTYYQNSSVKA